VLLDQWLSDQALLTLAKEIAQPVTSFIVEDNERHHIRWFSMTSEINLCGHGSLGAGAALIDRLGKREILLESEYGNITVSQQGDLYQMELPSWKAKPVKSNSIINALGLSPIDVFGTRDLVAVLDSEEAVSHFKPDFDLISEIEDYHGFIITAQGNPGEYVLRYFVPKVGIPEDIATGSAQCSLAPYWFDKMGATKLNVRQLSRAGGYFRLEAYSQESILISAHVKKRTELITIK